MMPQVRKQRSGKKALKCQQVILLLVCALKLNLSVFQLRASQISVRGCSSIAYAMGLLGR